MGAEKRLEKGKPIKKVVISRYCLQSEELKCLKAKYRAIRRKGQDRAKKKNKEYEKPEKYDK